MQSVVPDDPWAEDHQVVREPLPIDRRAWTHDTGELDLATGVVTNFE
jgi:hypothetical protein